ncbi:helix-hairpin-helix domain-containing protein [Aquimarina sp. W85]|uniref:helix-hairpin-helix domain-containing protein n=1 Tax=Aquimarina rhodophyticola TaxID=3342246 RepID=UPI003671E79A
MHQQHIDSLKCAAAQKRYSTFELKPFNPNFISDYKAYVLGLTPEQLQSLKEYRANNYWIHSIADFKKVTSVSDTLLNKIAPLFKFPSFNRYNKKSGTVLSSQEKKDLNTITLIDLKDIVGVPEFIAKRILNYREEISGFIDDSQLEDVKGLYNNQRIKILNAYTVKESPLKQKIRLAEASVKDLIRIPYIDFETAIKINDYQKNQGEIKNFKELEKIAGFHFEIIDKIALYLTIK